MTHKQESVDTILNHIETNWTETAKLVSPAVLRLVRVFQHLSRKLENMLSEYDLQIADFSVLAALRRSGVPYQLAPTQLYSSLLFSSGGLTKVLNRLSSLDYIERLDNPNDKRSKLVKLTSSGKQLIERLVVQQHNYEQSFLSPLTTNEQKHLSDLLSKLLKEEDK
ncbi:MarR family transcriptional regulator [Vibrio sp.]|nr:MarR family transcriptional regulator [Vibrio sp.]